MSIKIEEHSIISLNLIFNGDYVAGPCVRTPEQQVIAYERINQYISMCVCLCMCVCVFVCVCVCLSVCVCVL